jgi:homoserine kinase type II
MAVYTELSENDLAQFIAAYPVGALLACKGIAEGIENSNYLALTETAPYIITLYEKRVRPEDLPFYLGLMAHLQSRGINCPLPVAGHDGQAVRMAAGKPGALFTFLNGLPARRPARQHLASLGGATARLHQAAEGFADSRPNTLSLAGWQELAKATLPRADQVAPGLAQSIAGEIEYLSARWPTDLPTGIIHADLFTDNVFFRDNDVSGIIDFYFACTDMWAYEIAIVLNAWCFEPDGQFNSTKARDFLKAYHKGRPLDAAEREALPILCRGAALRFLLTRLYDRLNPVPDALVTPKDPLEYWAKLRFHQRVGGIGEYGVFDA